MTTFNRHYPFAQREFCFVFPWSMSRPTMEKLSIASEIPKGDGADLFVDDITKVIDESDLVPPFTPHNGEARTLNYGLTTNPPSGLPSGWNVSLSGPIGFIRATLFIRQNPSGFIDLNRPARRVHTLEFGIVCRASFAVVVQRIVPFGDYRFALEGYWKHDPLSLPADFWEAADTPPTVHRKGQLGHRDYHRQFVPADWVETVKSTLSGGTVPSDVSDYMDAWLDDLATDLAGATIDCTWRMAGIGWALPTDLGNRTFITQSNASRKY
jgi:hypothetical protein